MLYQRLEIAKRISESTEIYSFFKLSVLLELYGVIDCGI